MGNWANALTGLGEGLAGRGPQWQAAQTAERRVAYEEDLARREMQKLQEKERQRGLANTTFEAYRRLQMGDPAGAAEVLSRPLSAVPESLGEDATFFASTAEAIRAGSPKAKQALEMGLMQFKANGDFDMDLRALGIGQSTDKPSYGAQLVVRDSNDNLYMATRKDDGTVYAKLDPNSPDEPVGGVTLVSREGESPIEGRLRDVEAALKKESGKKEIAFRWDPQIKRRVQEETSAVLDDFKVAANTREKSKLYSAYDTAMRKLARAFDETWTGPIVGLMPAITSNQQAASAAVTVLTPILKELTRTPGEGTFSDGDRLVLENMLPKRTDKPAVIQAKIEMIDSFVREKLGTDATGGAEAGLSEAAKAYLK